MRLVASTLLAAIGLALPAMSATAVPIISIPASAQASHVVEITGRCGWAFHRNRWGHCVPNRYGYYRPYRYWSPYWPGYYGDGHGPWNRASPGDHVANRLNRQMLRGPYYGY
jgi:hypothetical protein